MLRPDPTATKRPAPTQTATTGKVPSSSAAVAAPATVAAPTPPAAVGEEAPAAAFAMKGAHEGPTDTPLSARAGAGGKKALDLRLQQAVDAGAARGAQRREAVRAREERRTTPTFPGRADLPAEDRLRAMTADAALGAPRVMTRMRNTPSATMRVIEETLGKRNAQHLSAEEAARGIGEPDLTSTIASHLARPLVDGGVPPVSPTPGAPHYALALKLADMMERMYAGATREEVVQFFRQQHPEVVALFPHLDASFLGALQLVYPFMPQWAQKPQPPPGHDPDVFRPVTREQANAIQLREALKVAAEIPLAMPLTTSVADELAAKQVFKNRRVVLVQHMLGQAVPFVHAMVRAGLDPAKADYVGVPYQENPAVQMALKHGYGMDVHVPRRGDIDAMYEEVGAAIDRAVKAAGPDEKILVIDDGGYASKWIHEHHRDKEHRFQVVEQTTRGLTEISKLDDPRFGIVNVAGSFGKRFESGQIGDVVVHAVRKVLDAVTTTPARKDVLVVGAGKVGAAVAKSFQGDGARVSVFDPFISKARKRELEKQGFRVITDKAEALKGKFLVVGASGHRSIDMNDFVEMSSPVFVASASSKKVEIDMLGLEQGATDTQGRLRKILAARVGEQETWHYWLKDGRIVTAMADGLPVNFQGVNSVAPELIDHTMALMLLGAGRAATLDGEKGLVELDERAQWKLQAQMEGLYADPGPGKPGAYPLRIFDETYWGTQQQWQAVAASPATPPIVREHLYGILYTMADRPELAEACFAPEVMFTAQMVDEVIARGDLNHIGKLLFHENIDVRTQQKILLFLGEVALDLEHGTFAGEKAANVRAARTNARGVTRWAVGGAFEYGSPMTPSRRVFVPKSGSLEEVFGKDADDPQVQRFVRERDFVLGQVRALMLSHPENTFSPTLHMFRKDPGRELMFPSGRNVLALRDRNWTGEQLYKLYTVLEKQARAMLHPPPEFLAEMSVVSTQHRASYLHDLFETFLEHPNASDVVRAAAAKRMQDLEEMLGDEVWFAPTDDWPVNELGIQYPEYG